MKFLITLASEIVILCLAVFWYIQTKDIEPLIAIIATGTAILVSIIKRSLNKKKQPSDMEQENSKAPNIKVDNSPNAIVQTNVHGNNIINQAIPEPKIIVTPDIANQQFNGSYKTVANLHVDSRVPLKNLNIRVTGRFVQSIAVEPQQAGVFMIGATIRGQGYIEANVPNASGSYKLVIINTQPDNVHIHSTYYP
jgi:hypothetical protein